MKIRLRLFATLQEYLPPGSSGGEALIEQPDDASIPDVLATVGVPLNEGLRSGAFAASAVESGALFAAMS